MSDDFDPYLEWLGIQKHDQPPTLYKLLGVDDFLDNANVIENAADKQMGFVRTFQTGPRSVLSQRILNELSTARVTLLNPQSKAAYDGKLRKLKGQQVTPTRVAKPLVAAKPIGPTTVQPVVEDWTAAVADATSGDGGSSSRRRQRARGAAKSNTAVSVVMWGIGIPFAILAGLGLVSLLRGSPEPVVVNKVVEQPTAKAEAPIQETRAKSPTTSAKEPNAQPVATRSSVERTVVPEPVTDSVELPQMHSPLESQSATVDVPDVETTATSDPPPDVEEANDLPTLATNPLEPKPLLPFAVTAKPTANSLVLPSYLTSDDPKIAKAVKAIGNGVGNRKKATVDLIPLIDVAKLSLNREWTKNTNVLHCPSVHIALCVLPVQIYSPDYELKIRFRKRGRHLHVRLPLMINPASGLASATDLAFGAWEGVGVESVDNKGAVEAGTTRSCPWVDDTEYTATIQVRAVDAQKCKLRLSFVAASPGSPPVMHEWLVAYGGAVGHGLFTPPNPSMLIIGGHDLNLEIQQLELTLGAKCEREIFDPSFSSKLRPYRSEPPKLPPGIEVHHCEANGHTYGFADWPQDFARAQQAASKLGGRLLVIDDKQEYQFIVDKAGRDRSYWLGVRELGRTNPPVWVDSRLQPVNITHWAAGEPRRQNEEVCLVYGNEIVDDAGPEGSHGVCIEWGDDAPAK